MPSLLIVNNFSLSSQGVTKSGKQGAAADGADDAYTITVSGYVHQVTGLLPTASAVTVFDDDDDFPTDFVYLHFWADVAMYVQFIGSATSAVFKVGALQPFVLTGYDNVLGVASTTPITGGAEPVTTDIDSVVLGNYSGGSGNYVFSVIQ